MKRLSFIILVLAGVIGFAAGDVRATIEEVKGKVEIKTPKKSWTKAEAGMTLENGTMISTGFNSQAVLKLGPSTVIARPLTRMTLEELVEKEGTITTELFLNVGKVQAEVKSSEGIKNDFLLKSVVSTAAVRGSMVIFDGRRVTFLSGSGVAVNLYGQKRYMSKGDVIDIPKFRPPSLREADKIRKALVNPQTGLTGLLPPDIMTKALVVVAFVWVTDTIDGD
ncbi:MAG: hypothetical protein JW881_11980 [Spirochaetales bacterium]|nr:hypothetical protein [Spirochaetales bacterium]